MDFSDELKAAIDIENFAEAIDIIDNHLFSKRELCDLAL